jgi:hypothetical protein
MNPVEKSLVYSSPVTVTDRYGARSEARSAPADTGVTWPAINATAISNMIVMLTISLRYWDTCFFTVALRHQV